MIRKMSLYGTVYVSQQQQYKEMRMKDFRNNAKKLGLLKAIDMLILKNNKG
jgi:hypothetical protein